MPEGLLPVALQIGGILVLLFIFLVIYAFRYTRVRPNEALIVYGRKHVGVLPGGNRGIVGHRVVLSGGTFVWPIFERAERVSLETFGVRAEGDGFEAQAHAKIKGDPASVAAAAERFLSKKPEEVALILGDILRRHLRASEGDREEWVRRMASEELAPMGYEIVSLAVKERGA